MPAVGEAPLELVKERKMKKFTVFARYEPTTDDVARKYCPPKQLAALRDTVIYSTADARGVICRFSWWMRSRPTRRNRRVTINCFTRPLVWI